MSIDSTPPVETRDKILDSALEIFSEKGYDTASISEICKKADITKGALYWHFKDKLDLYQQLIEKIINGVIKDSIDLITGTGSPLERLCFFNRKHLRLVQEQEFYQKALLMFLRELRTDRIAEMYKSMEVLNEKYNFELVFKQAIEAKELSDLLTPREYVELYRSVMASLIINWLIKGKKFDLCSKGEKYFEYMFRLDLEKEKK